MRVLWKLSVIVLCGVAVQWALTSAGRDEIDEGAFVLRVMRAQWAGVPVDDPKLLDDARQLLHRRCNRAGEPSSGELARETEMLASAFEVERMDIAP